MYQLENGERQIEESLRAGNNMDKFGWCFIGTGRLAEEVAKQISAGNHKIVSCYTRNYENGKKFAEKYGTTAYQTAEEAILAEGVEAVYVVTPHNAHFRYVKEALELGKPVFCEKAFTVTAEETDELIRIAGEKNLYLAEAMWTWFGAAANQVKKWNDEGKLGVIREADFTYHMRSISYAPRVSDPKRAGGALLDITVYPITYAYRLFGYPVKIESKGKIANGIDECEDVKMTFANGTVANISASIIDMKGLEKMTLKGEKATVKSLFYHAANKVTLKRGLFQKEVFSGPNINLYLNEFNIVSDEIKRGLKESELVPLKATSDVMHIMDEIRKQIGLDYTTLE